MNIAITAAILLGTILVGVAWFALWWQVGKYLARRDIKRMKQRLLGNT